MADPLLPIHTSPRTDSQLRAILNRLRRSTETLITDLGSLEDRVIKEATASAAVSTGDVLYASAAGQVARAQANSATTYKAVGVALNSAALGETVIYITIGVVVLSGLTFNTVYYLSATTPGAITATAPSTAGQYVVPIGKALSATDLMFMPLTPVLL